MQIDLTLSVEPEDVDAGHDMGITESAYERLNGALLGAGFEIIDGPTGHEDL